VVSFTPRLLYPRGKGPRYPTDESLVGPQSWSGRCREEKILDPTRTQTQTPWSSSLYPVTLLITLSRLLYVGSVLMKVLHITDLCCKMSHCLTENSFEVKACFCTVDSVNWDTSGLEYLAPIKGLLQICEVARKGLKRYTVCT
jgi:hypothetical protein